MALGASVAQVRGSVLWSSVRLVCIGLTIGITGALGLAHLLAALIYGIQPADLAPYAVTCIVFFAAGLLAAWMPARRAMRVDPMVALRQL
jgi:ABC-type antimicrobial peptide transport system permease subunit